jgi:hypothetical protein
VTTVKVERSDLELTVAKSVEASERERMLRLAALHLSIANELAGRAAELQDLDIRALPIKGGGGLERGEPGEAWLVRRFPDVRRFIEGRRTANKAAWLSHYERLSDAHGARAGEYRLKALSEATTTERR